MSDLTGKRILVVEDEPLIAMVLEDILIEFGSQVVGPAKSVDSALDLAREEAIDAAVLDLNLAGRKSYPVAEELQRRDVPYLFATGYGGDDLAPEQSGAVTVAKPYKSSEIGEALLKLLRDSEEG